MPLPFDGTEPPALTLPQSHCDEVTEIQDTDAHVRATIEWAIAVVELCGRTLPSPSLTKHRYSETVKALRYVLHDDMPAPREHGDDPWAED